MSAHKELYVPLLTAPLDDSDQSQSECTDSGHPSSFAPCCKRSRRTLRRVVAFACAAIVSLLGVLLWVYTQYSSMRHRCPDFHLYSPADEAVKFKKTQFVPDFYSRNIYLQPPSPHVDEAWEQLYDEQSAVQIPQSEVQKMANQTASIPPDSDNHLVALMVFHQLHCLDILRKAIYPEVYLDGLMTEFGNEKEVTDHMNHCLDSVRQGIMCAADITPITYHWNRKGDKLLGRMDIVQTCRDFGRIQEWADQHRFQGDLSPYF